MSDKRQAEELEKMLAGAISIESYQKYGYHSRPDNKIGTVQHGQRMYDLFEGNKGDIYYQVRIETEDGIKSEFEYIFGITEKQMMQRLKARKAKQMWGGDDRPF